MTSALEASLQDYQVIHYRIKLDIFKTDTGLIFWALSRDNWKLQYKDLMLVISQLVKKDFSLVISQKLENILVISKALKLDL